MTDLEKTDLKKMVLKKMVDDLKGGTGPLAPFIYGLTALTEQERVGRMSSIGPNLKPKKGNVTLAARLWQRVLLYVERRWLLANGWVENERGMWILPPWHPKRDAAKRTGERASYNPEWVAYDHSHAVNSLKKHSLSVTTRRWESPAVYPAYIEYAMLPTLCWCAAFLLNGVLVLTNTPWTRSLILLAAVGTNLLGFALHLRIRRELRRDYAEEQLRKGSTE